MYIYWYTFLCPINCAQLRSRRWNLFLPYAKHSCYFPKCVFFLQDCRQKFQGGSFFDHEGLPYCETHYHAKRGSLCAGCHKPITGEYETSPRNVNLPSDMYSVAQYSLYLSLFAFRSLHNSHVPQIPSRALRVRVLPETAEQGYLQGAKRQTVLPWLLRQALRMNTPMFASYTLWHMRRRRERERKAVCYFALDDTVLTTFDRIRIRYIYTHTCFNCLYKKRKTRDETRFWTLRHSLLENFHFLH